MPWLDKIVARQDEVRHGPLAGYVAALAFVAMSLGARLLLADVLLGNPFLTFWPAIVGAAYVGGLLPGLAAVLLSFVCAWVTSIPPYGSFQVASAADAIGLVLFGVIAVSLCLIVAGFHAAVARLAEAQRRDQDARALLELRVAERTRQLARQAEELESANKSLRAEIVERRRAEEMALQSQKLEVVGQLAGGVAHDFNNLLTVIIGNLDRARRLIRDEPELERLVASAMQAGERAAALTHRLLLFSRRRALAPVVVDLNQLINGMSDLIHRTLNERIQIETKLARGLWSTFCDANQLEMAILNLVVNARDAMPSGGRLIIETTNVQLGDGDVPELRPGPPELRPGPPELRPGPPELRPGPYVMVAVTDTGAGMSEETLRRVFEPFFTTKQPGQGTGLGLSTVFGFIRQSGGHVVISSKPNQGTTVRLYLPYRAANHAGEAGTRTEPVLQARPGCMVLVAEDNGEVRDFVTASLRDLGYAVDAAADGASALEIAKRAGRLDLLVTDIGLPKMGGAELAARVRQLHRAVKVLLISAYVQRAVADDGYRDTDIVLLAKPFTSDALSRKVAEMLSADGAASDASSVDGVLTQAPA